MSKGLNVISLNVRGIRERGKRNRILQWCKHKKGDIVFLQETYSTPEVEALWRSEWEGSLYFAHGTNHSKGVLVLIASSLNINIQELKIDNEGRYVIFKGEIRGTKVVMGNLYFPTRDKEKEQLKFLNNLDKIISDMWSQEYALVFGGDYNLIMDSRLDYMGANIPVRNKYNEAFEAFLNKYYLEDIWRRKNPNKKQFTFKQKQPIVQTRLDYWFISSDLEKLVQSCDILLSITPDHSGVILRFRNLVDNFTFGKSYWKFNNSLCEDKFFVEKMNDEIRELKEQLIPQISDKRLLWDFMKMKMREFIITFSKEKAKVRRLAIKRLENEIEELEKQLLLTPARSIVDDIENKKATLKKMYEYSRQGLKVRSRAEWVEEGENNIQYFEQLLKSNKRKSVIREVYSKEGEIISDKKRILKIIKEFYENLYSQTKRQIDRSLSFFNNIPSLCEESKELCEGKVTKEECYNVLKEMKINKSPGNDGLTVEFYHTFWPVLGDIIVEALNEAFDKGHLANSQKQGVITLIEKEGKDPMYIQNYRPITLLNVDYKILSKVLAKRIREVLGEVIHHDQVGYIKDRNIGEAVRVIEDMFFHSMNQNNGFLVAADFEKAFDSVDHDFIYFVLEIFGFGHSFRTWVKTLYTDTRSCVLNGGHSTGYFTINKGVRQGDPLSPYLFLLAIEILACAVRGDKIIKGFTFGEYEVRQVLYADDLTLFVKDENSIIRLQNIFEEFEKISGLRMNKGKTYFVWMGKENEKPNISLFGNLVNKVKILGIYFSLDIKIREDMNYKEILSKIKRQLGWWKQRDLSMTGKIHLMKTYALSKLNYVTSLTAVPKWVVTEVEKITFEFLWSGKDRIKRDILFQDYKNGGLRMTNYRLFIQAQRISWLKRLLYGNKQMGWKMFFDYCCRLVGGRFIFLCDYELAKLKLRIPHFYMDILQAWEAMRECRTMDGELVNPIILNNRNVCLRGKMFFSTSFYEKEIYTINHILDKGRMKHFQYFLNLGVNSSELLTVYDIYNSLPEDLKNEEAPNKFQSIDLLTLDLELKVLGQKIQLRNIHSRKIYELFVNKLQNCYNLKIKDDQNNFEHTEEEINETFVRPRTATLLSKHREFQYMLLHGVIYTKKHLLRFGFVGNDLCSFCNQETETYEHTFLKCKKVEDTWRAMITYYDLIEIRDMNWEDIFLGLPGRSVRIKFVNSLIIMIKYIIFKSRGTGTLPSFHTFQKRIEENIEAEKKIATTRGKLGVHLLKWEYAI